MARNLRGILYLREILWNTLDEFPRFLLLNLRLKSSISSDSQRLIEIVFVVQLQSNFARIFTIGKTILENLTGELDATNIKQFEINLFFNTSFLV